MRDIEAKPLGLNVYSPVPQDPDKIAALVAVRCLFHSDNLTANALDDSAAFEYSCGIYLDDLAEDLEKVALRFRVEVVEQRIEDAVVCLSLDEVGMCHEKTLVIQLDDRCFTENLGRELVGLECRRDHRKPPHEMLSGSCQLFDYGDA